MSYIRNTSLATCSSAALRSHVASDVFPMTDRRSVAPESSFLSLYHSDLRSVIEESGPRHTKGQRLLSFVAGFVPGPQVLIGQGSSPRNSQN